MLLTYFILAVLLLMVPLAKFPEHSGGIHADYLSPQNTLPIKGLFTVIVMMSHFRGYVQLPDDLLNTSFSTVTDWIGQLMVAIFFFYSGFGIYESVKKRGGGYVRSFPKRRLFTVWLSFAICVALYVIAALVTQKPYSISTILLAFTGWTAVGNSNWFMFVTFALYAIFILAFWRFEKAGPKKTLWFFWVLCLVLFAILYVFKESWWWDTLFCFPAGMLFSVFKGSIDKQMSKPLKYWGTMITIALVFCVTYKLSYSISHLFYLIASVCFCLLVVGFTMKVKVRSTPLGFMGKHVFSVYILQRLVYMFVGHFVGNVYVFFAASVVLTVAVAWLFDDLFGKLKERILAK